MYIYVTDKSPTPERSPEPAPKSATDPTVFHTPKITMAKTKHKISPLKLRKEILNGIANKEKKYK